MKFAFTARQLALAMAAAGVATTALATNGYFSHGYGMKAKGMGGTALANSEDVFAGANNPATAAYAGNKIEGGLDVFMPKRGMSRTDSGAGLNANVDSDSNTFLVPEFALNRQIDKQLGVGVSVYGNGGLNTDYAGGQLNCGQGPNTANVLCGSGKLGVDMMQLVVAPTVAYKLSQDHAIGVSPLLVYQQFKAEGLQAFDNPPGFPPFTGNPGKVTNNGKDSSTGVGVRLGYMGKLTDTLTFGASYSPKTKMSKFGKYAGLFADGGSFDIPENYGVGVNMKLTPQLSIGMDYQRINYSKVSSVGNPSTNQAPLGANGGPGFGWSDISVVKVGAEYKVDKDLTLRAGINKGGNPVQSRDVSFNILAPGVVTTHFTLGGTYAMSPTSELTVAYMNARSNSVTGSSLFNGVLGAGAGGNETVRMKQNSIGVQFGMRY